MLTGLKGILEKAVQIAAPIIGGSMFGAPGAMFGSGIASLISGDKPRDALIKAAVSGAAGFRGQGGKGTSIIDRVRNPLQEIVQINRSNTDPNKRMRYSNIIDTAKDLGSKIFEQRGTEKDPKPSFGMQALSTGLPAYLSYLAAKEDRDKANVPDASEYMSAVDKMYGGQFERPPEERRIQNLTPTYAAAGGMMGQQPVNGLKAMEPIQYSAATGQGVMGLAKGGAIDIKELETLMEDGDMSYEEAMDYLKSIQGKAMGGKVFPRKTGQIEGPGTKTSDSIPAMLSDGEFVQRTDAVNGAGVMMGAKNAQQAREKGADFMYALQDKLAKMGQRVA